MYRIMTTRPYESSAVAMMKALPIVYVVDDDISIRESLELLIRGGGWQPELFSSGDEFLSFPRIGVANCLLLDVNLPGLSGLELQKLISGNRADMPIIFISGIGDVPMTVKAMKAGAVEFLTKPFDAEVLLEAIGSALKKSAEFLDRESESQSLHDDYNTLSRRERQVMSLVVAGKLNKQVAFELGISEITVKAHRGQVMKKMNARSLPDLVNMAAKLSADGSEQPSL